MVDTLTPDREVITLAYTPVELNRLVSREIAGRLHEIAAEHRTIGDAMAAVVCVTPGEIRRSAWHHAEAERLEQRAAAELVGVTDGPGR